MFFGRSLARIASTTVSRCMPFCLGVQNLRLDSTVNTKRGLYSRPEWHKATHPGNNLSVNETRQLRD